MNGFTLLPATSTVTTREVLLPPPLPAAAPRAPWLESVAKSVPPSNPFSKARPMAGPSIWKLALLGPLGLPIGPAILLPSWSKTSRSGVKGLVGENDPPVWAVSLLLQLLPAGRPLPDSMTRTLNRFWLPWKAMPVGKFNPLAKTETLYPLGRAMSSP